MCKKGLCVENKIKKLINKNSLCMKKEILTFSYRTGVMLGNNEKAIVKEYRNIKLK